MNNDRTIMLMSPTMAHRCYVQADPLLPDPDRQANFCLGANHTQCPLYAPLAARTVESNGNSSSAGRLPLLAPATLPMPMTQSTQLVRVQSQPFRPPNTNRILLPRRQQAVLARRRAPKTLLLPAVSSYSARQIHRWSFLSTKVTIAATIFLVLLTVASGYIIQRQQLATARTYQASNVIVYQDALVSRCSQCRCQSNRNAGATGVHRAIYHPHPPTRWARILPDARQQQRWVVDEQ